MTSSTRRLAAGVVLAVVTLAFGSGCVVVKPWERDVLARNEMAWDPDPLEAALDSHIFFAKEASLAGGGAAGGGCGCN